MFYTTGIFNAGILIGKGEYIKIYMKYFIVGKSLREFAKHLEISLPTPFKWPHRLLAAIESSQNQVVLKSVVESDDIYITCSHKGQRNLVMETRK